MITDAIHDYVAGQLSGLWNLPKPQRRARLAELRRGVGHQPGDLPALWGSFLQELPNAALGPESRSCRAGLDREQRPASVQRTGHSGFHARGVPLPPGDGAAVPGK